MIKLENLMDPLVIFLIIAIFIYVKIMFHYCHQIIPGKVPKWIIYYGFPLIISESIVYIVSLQLPLAVLYTIVTFILLTCFYFTFDAKLEHLYWAALNFTFHLITLRGIVIGGYSLASFKNMYQVIENENTYMITLIITVSLMAFFLFLFNKNINTDKIKTLLNNKVQLRFVYISETVIFMFNLFSTYAYYYNLDLVWFTIFHIITSIMTLSSYYMTFNYAVKMSIWQKEEIDNKLIQKNLKRQLLRHNNQKIMLENVKKYNHDIKNLIYTTNILLNKGEYHQAKEMLNSISKEVNMNVEKMKKFSNHNLIDSLLYEVYLNCHEVHIQFEAECFIPKSNPVSDLDLCRILNNLTDNAFEACSQINSDQKKNISIKSKVDNEWFTILVENTFNEENLFISHNYLQTTKKNKEYHGMGITNIKEIVEKYHGNTKIEIHKDTHIFSFWIVLPAK